MKNNIFLTAICALLIVGAFMGGRLYESRQNEIAAQEKNQNIYTIKDILTEADFDIEGTELSYRPETMESHAIVINPEENRKQIISELLDLEFIPSAMIYNFKEGATMKLNLNQNYTIFVYEQEKNMYFRNDANELHSYNIINPDKFFNVLNTHTKLYSEE